MCRLIHEYERPQYNGKYDLDQYFQSEMERNSSGSGAGFEPSADELIEVLKNLENLAASNPPLYKAIVEQIKSECR